MILAPGGFLLMGLMIGGFNLLTEYQDKQKAAKNNAVIMPTIGVQRSEG